MAEIVGTKSVARFLENLRAAKMAVGMALAALLAGCGGSSEPWNLVDISGHFPDLQLKVETAGNSTLTAADLKGDVVLLFFGYTHCPDVCPLTLSRLADALNKLGADASHVRILFVSVDPARDTPALVGTYARAFSEEAIGATGTPGEIEDLARRYRIAYQAQQPDADGNYEVMHSKAVYVFDSTGRARLMIRDNDSTPMIASDLRRLIKEG